jgi:multidrug/hemolysin transport system ATP-binding protein
VREKYAQDKLSLICTDPDALIKLLDASGTAYTAVSDRLIVPIQKTLDALPLIERCREYISGFEVTAGTMDDAFIGITGKELRQ